MAVSWFGHSVIEFMRRLRAAWLLPYTQGRHAGRNVFLQTACNLSTPAANLPKSRYEIDGEVLIMSNRLLAASVLSTAVGLALAAQAPSVRAQGANPPQVVKDNMARMAKDKLEKCYGINAAAKNDCAEGAHSCAGQSTQARDTKSFVLLPAGDCAKIQGGKTTAT
jgi:uncharacterized membrane protein